MMPLDGSGRVDRHAARERLEQEAARIARLKQAGAVPEACGDAYANAPARGCFEVVDMKALYPKGESSWDVRSSGYAGRSTVVRADVFDRMRAQAARRRSAMPLSPGQIAMARYYRDLSERHACAGMRCASLEALGSGSGGNGHAAFMDAVLDDGAELKRLHDRIGPGVAMAVRRVRPSARGTRRSIASRSLVDAVCIHDLGLDDVLRGAGWSVDGKARNAVRAALMDALDRMQGPVVRHGVVVSHDVG